MATSLSVKTQRRTSRLVFHRGLHCPICLKYLRITASDADGTASVLLRSTSLSTFLGVVSTTVSLNFVSAE